MNIVQLKLTLFLALLSTLLFTASSSQAQIMVDPCIAYPDEPFCIDPVVLVPALTTSFNIQTLFRDQPSDNWRFVPGGNIYKALIERLEDAGYTEGINLFVAHYDWRQSNQTRSPLPNI